MERGLGLSRNGWPRTVEWRDEASQALYFTQVGICPQFVLGTSAEEPTLL